MQYSFTGGTTRNRTGVKAFAELCLTAWLWCRSHIIVANFNKKSNSFCASLNNKMLKIYFRRCYSLCFDNIDKKLVPVTGLGPVRLIGSRDFKSLASAYFATPATKNIVT